MFKKRFPILVFILFVVYSVENKELPKYIKRCALRHKFRECVIKSAKDAIPSIVKGDAAYGIPNMTPLHIPFVAFMNTPMLSLNMTNLEIYGLDKAEMIDLISDPDKMFFVNVMKIPNVTLSGHYVTNGQVMVMSVNGEGQFTMILENGIYKLSQFVKPAQIKGMTVYQSYGEKLEFQLDKVSFDLDNLFNGDEKLGKQVNKFLNDNWRLLSTEFGPLISQTVTSIFNQIFNGIAKEVPTQEVYLPD